MFLTLFFCALAGSPCKSVPVLLPPFPTFEACIARSDELVKGVLRLHPDWQEAGARCSAAKPQ
jgi:hypothetical protein